MTRKKTGKLYGSLSLLSLIHLIGSPNEKVSKFTGEKDCKKSGEKRRCAACHIVAHTDCFERLKDLNLQCRTTYRDAENRKQSEAALREQHHWVHKWKLDGKCLECHKGFQQKRFREKELIGVTCTWCKEAYHNKPECFSQIKLDERCHMGVLHDLIVPPSWVVRRPGVHRQHDDLTKKSGGNKQGAKTLHKLCWLLNPRQVFDITTVDPKYSLEMYRNACRSLWILVCGGDGTVGWVLSTLDELKWPIYPPIAVLPMGTGNDLARTLGWGGSFNNEPISNYLEVLLRDASVTELDRWKLEVEPNWDCILNQTEIFNEHEQANLPLNVMNNYFSIGADAHVALQFHHSRSANPQMLNSRFRNRIAYGGLGTINLFKRTWKDLSNYVRLECDGDDYTNVVKSNRFHCLLFHNITYYAGGTIPWGNDGDDSCSPTFHDGRIEVIGFTTAQLAALQMGGRGERIAQCSHVRLVTSKAIPMQVDGEPCLLSPSSINLTFHNKVIYYNPEPCSSNTVIAGKDLVLEIQVSIVSREEYEMHMEKPSDLIETAYELGSIETEIGATVRAIRSQVQDLFRQHPCLPYDPEDSWRFLDFLSDLKKNTFCVKVFALQRITI
ncbi:unnamed protein product [Enterobius vermicularis]|uniref:Diacylglycerol kinase n=1 Tax=Enterobius vermicularis TaxID=51028 RepID=A0A158Q9V5_ENTVE|nr:unnamed protein product [Enterobius vermicularis]